MARSQPITSSAAFGGTISPLGFDFQIVNAPTPYVALTLQPGKRFLAESGTLMMKGRQVEMDVGFGNGLNEQGMMGALITGLKRKMAGEGFLTQKFTNMADSNQPLLLAAPHPGQILAIDLDEHKGEILCQRGSFLAAPAGTDLTFHVRQKLGFALFGGEEFVMQKVSGEDVVFLNAGGGIHVEDLDDGQEIQIDTGCLVATSREIKTSVAKAGSLKSALFGQEGFFLATCRGPGRVWIQSMPFALSVATISAEQERQASNGRPKSALDASPK